MAHRSKLAHLRIRSYSPSYPTVQTFILEQIDKDYRVSVIQRDHLTRSTSRQRVDVSASEVKEQFARLSRLTVPAYPVSPPVCDGACVELQIMGEQSSLSMTWMSIAPEGAEGLSGFADWLRQTGLGQEEEIN